MTQAQALKILKTGANVFLTGEPGAGKSYIVTQYVDYLRAHEVEVAVTASTGIAATHIGGQTIHAWSGLGIKKDLSAYDLDRLESTEYLVKRIKNTKVLIIDEISMIDPQTLAMIDLICRTLRKNEEIFGGLQVILVGDFFQLPPVNKNHSEAHYAFESTIWLQLSLIICYLNEQHRQKDNRYLSFLTAIRRNEITDHDLFELTTHLSKHQKNDRGEITRLYSHNLDVDKLNDQELAKLKTASSVYFMKTKGRKSLVDSLIKGCLSPERLELKVGASVMCTKNNNQKGYANGTMGTVVAFERGTYFPIIENRRGERITIEPSDWIIEENGKPKAAINQIPLRLAWAITIHKSQGMSLDCAVIDLKEVFEYGQGYVALSRVKSFEGLQLLGWNQKAFKINHKILIEDQKFRQQSQSAEVIFGDMPSDQIQKMQDDFLLFSGGVLQKKQKEKTEKRPIDTLQLTLMMVLQAKGLTEISLARDLTVTTVLSHLEKLVLSKRLEYADIQYLIGPEIEGNLADIKKTFLNYDTSKLKPVFEHYQGKFSYEQLHLAKLLLFLNK